MTPEQFVDFFCTAHPTISPAHLVTRIEWVHPAIEVEA
jgi:2-keto-4-pentenoate hydratase